MDFLKLITSFVNQALLMIALVSLVNFSSVSKMIWIFMFFAISIALIDVARSENKLTVTFSEQSQFVNLNQNGTPTGLDALIIQNFAEIFKFKVNYSPIEPTLNHIFHNKDHFNEFLSPKTIKYDHVFCIVKNINKFNWFQYFFKWQRYYHRRIRWQSTDEWIFRHFIPILSWWIDLVCPEKWPNSTVEKCLQIMWKSCSVVSVCADVHRVCCDYVCYATVWRYSSEMGLDPNIIFDYSFAVWLSHGLQPKIAFNPIIFHFMSFRLHDIWYRIYCFMDEMYDNSTFRTPSQIKTGNYWQSIRNRRRLFCIATAIETKSGKMRFNFS